jgi:acyl-coenzyme A thioesterase PaaI-like protein
LDSKQETNNTVGNSSVLKTEDAHQVLKMWNKFGHSKAGRKLFNFILGRIVPYTGNIKAEVLMLGGGEVTVAMNDRRAVRNHLKSIHAIALANLGELASGLAMFSKVSNSTRAIVVDLEIKYLKKARGRLIATGKANPPDIIDSTIKSIVEAEIKDADGDVVATIKVHWLLSPPIEAT